MNQAKIYKWDQLTKHLFNAKNWPVQLNSESTHSLYALIFLQGKYTDVA